ncbi:hypothetical protein [Rhodococcus sp. BH5]|uniref:hypothetical protein n=1 Tax=Rhodococcus sp. BH5 TaxID=2871702 RepID=UPI0022CD79B6|nr:hypothetical protein [Rhodococcus sp. BH5]MCZ9635269.1 hypothetical protein [Rhodococcus sp. BH5]
MSGAITNLEESAQRQLSAGERETKIRHLVTWSAAHLAYVKNLPQGGVRDNHLRSVESALVEASALLVYEDE